MSVVAWRTAAQAAELLTSGKLPTSVGWVETLREIGDEGITFAVEPAKVDGTWWLVERPEHYNALLGHGVDPSGVWTRWAVAGILMNQPAGAGRLTLGQLAFELVARLGPTPRHHS